MTKIQFNTLIMHQTNSLHLYALHFSHDADEANDLVQDTLLRAMTHYNKFREGTNIKGWLYTIMKNIFINNYRRLSRTSSLVVQADNISSANLVHSSTKNEGESQFIIDDIKHALDKLPQEYCVPFTMYFEGHKYHEIADCLIIPIGTVKTRIHIARKILKKALKPYETPTCAKDTFKESNFFIGE